MRILVLAGFVLNVAFTATQSFASAGDLPMMIGIRSDRHDPVEIALRKARISSQSRIRMNWKKINLQNVAGRFFNVNLVVCKNSKVESCQAISQLAPVDKTEISSQSNSKSISARILGSIMARNDVTNLRMGVRFVNEDGLSRTIIEFESFALADLVDNDITVKFSDNSEVELQLL